MKVKFVTLLIFLVYNTASSQIYFNFKGHLSLPHKPNTFLEEWEGIASFGAGIGLILKDKYSIQFDFSKIKFGLSDELISELKYEELVSELELLITGVKIKSEILKFSKNISSNVVIGLGYGHLKQGDIKIKNYDFSLEIKGIEKKGISSLIGLELGLKLSRIFQFYLGSDYIFFNTNIKEGKSIKMILITSGINFHI